MLIGAPAHQRIFSSVLGADMWFDSMRQPGGYGGPVTHWWFDCLEYTGPGLDWRYEGIIIGYINLWGATGEKKWLEKAQRAGDDLLAGQLPGGNFRNSAFELNPATAGTPHEAACDLGLLRLAAALKSAGRQDWQNYLAAAERNLTGFYIARLWDDKGCYFRDDPRQPSFVPNKAATLVEALFAWCDLTADQSWIETYALPTLERILEHQVQSGELAGAIYQNSFGGRQESIGERQNNIGGRKIARFFPFYIARCLPALWAAALHTGDRRYQTAALSAARFVLRWRYPDGSFAQVVYPRGRVNRYPQWIAAAGDILRCLDLLRPAGLDYADTPSLEWLLAGQRPDGGFRTAQGFGKITPGGKTDDPRDELSVCGWADKAFRYLTGLMKTGSISRIQREIGRGLIDRD